MKIKVTDIVETPYSFYQLTIVCKDCCHFHLTKVALKIPVYKVAKEFKLTHVVNG